MDDQDRLRILYELTLRDIDHNTRNVVRAVKHWAPIVVLVLLQVTLGVIYGLSPSQLVTVTLALVPASVLAYVAWTNTADDRAESLTLEATKLRLQINTDEPIATDRSNTAREIEQNISNVQRRLRP